jgi:hypothetical protein
MTLNKRKVFNRDKVLSVTGGDLIMGMPYAKKCIHCNDYFESIHEYNTHLKNDHPRECQLYIGDAFKCTSCSTDTYFDTCSDLQDHTTEGNHN